MTQNNNNLIDANNINKVSKLDYKIVIIGSGAGGSVTAKILSEKGHEVLIVEEGQNFTDHKKVGLSKNLDKWRNYGATPIFSNESIISYAEGKCVGGSTEINGALMWRTPDDVLDKWSKYFEIEDLDTNNMKKYFEEYEKEMTVNYQDENESNIASKKLIKAASILNWSTARVKRAQINCKNTNQCPIGCPTGAKRTMKKTYIQKALNNGADLLYNARAEKIKVDRNKAKKILIKNGLGKRFYISFKYLFVSAGPIQTPLLLKKSGINKYVGSNFFIHPNIKIAVKFDEKINASKGTMMTRQVNHFQKDGFTIGSSNYSPSYLSIFTSNFGEEGKKFLKDWKNVAMYISLLKVKGTGKINRIPFTDFPFITYKYHKDDKTLIKKSLKKMIQLFFTINAKQILTPLKEKPLINSIEEFERIENNENIFSNLDISSVHGMSSCRMSGDPEKYKTPLNGYGKLHGFENIYISDASIIPTSPGINPQETVATICMRNAYKFCELNN